VVNEEDRLKKPGKNTTYLFAYAAEGAGGGVFPEETRE
jgi:hypothetical protein